MTFFVCLYPSSNTQLVYCPTPVFILNLHFKPDSLLFRFYQLPCQLLPPQSFIHNIRSLFIQRDRGLPPWQPLAQTADLPSTQVTLLGDKRILQNGRLALFLFNTKNALWIKTHAAKCLPQMPIDCIVTSLEHASLEISRWFPVQRKRKLQFCMDYFFLFKWLMPHLSLLPVKFLGHLIAFLFFVSRWPRWVCNVTEGGVEIF